MDAQNMTGSAAVVSEPCVHDSTRADGTLDSCCLRCGTDGYWHEGHAHHVVHPSGKLLVRLDCDA
jgi:hypothetical protein